MKLYNDGVCACVVPRVCGGSRTAGSVYSECGLSSNGLPLEHFLLSPTIPINADEFGLSAIGVKLIQRMTPCLWCKGTGLDNGSPCKDCNGAGGKLVWHILDMVGSEYQPTDMTEEIRSFGMSRKLSPKLDFSKLTLESRHLLCHQKAFIVNPSPYFDSWVNIPRYGLDNPCPKQVPLHIEQVRTKHDKDEMCLGVLWQNVEGDELIEGRIVKRRLPSLEYVAAKKPDKVETEYRLAIFASMPITRIVVVKGGENDDDTLKKVSRSGKRVDLVDE